MVNCVHKHVTYFGEVDIFIKKNRRTCCVASKKCHLMIMSRMEFESIVQDEFPHIFGELSKIALQRYENELQEAAEKEKIFRKKKSQTVPDDTVCRSLLIKPSIEEKTAKNPLQKTTQNLYDESLSSFPIEDVLKSVENRKVTNINFEESQLGFEVFDGPTDSQNKEIKILFEEFDNCKKILQGKLETELKIRQDLKKNLEEKVKAGENTTKTDFSNIKLTINPDSTPRTAKIRQIMNSEMIHIQKRLHDMNKSADEQQMSNQALEAKIDSMMMAVQKYKMNKLNKNTSNNLEKAF